MALAPPTTRKNPTRQARTMRPVSGRGSRFSCAMWCMSFSRSTEMIAGECALAADHVVEVERDRGGWRRRERVVGHQDAQFAGLVRADLDDKAAVIARRNDVDERAGEAADGEREFAPLQLLVDDP